MLLKFKLENISDNNFNNSTVILQEADKIIMPICKFRNNKPVMTFKIWLSIMIDEVISNDNHSYSSINGIKNYITPVIEHAFYDLVNEKLQNTISAMQENKYDVLNIYSKFNAFEYKKFKEYLSTLSHPIDYMENITIEIDFKLNYVI